MDLQPFLKWLQKCKYSIETRYISQFYEISIDDVREWAKRHKVEYLDEKNDYRWNDKLLDAYINPRFRESTQDFLKWLEQEHHPLETKYIAQYCKCSIRLIQKWAQNNDIPYKFKGGRKYYIWIKDEVLNDVVSYGRRIITRNRGDKEHKQKERKAREKGYKILEEITTCKEVSKRINDPNNNIFFNGKSKIRSVQIWAKENDVPFVIKNNRKYYTWTDEWIAKYEDRRPYKPRILKKKGYGSLFVAKRNYLDKESVDKWAKENGVPYISDFNEYLVDIKEYINFEGEKYIKGKQMIEYNLVFPDRIEHKNHRGYLLYIRSYNIADDRKEYDFDIDFERYGNVWEDFYKDLCDQKEPYCWNYIMIYQFEDWYKSKK